jgi:H+/gluconate symporter-like permease
LIILIILKINIVITAPIVSSLIAILNNLNILNVLNNQYLIGFSNFVQNYLFIFLLSAILGNIMDDSGDASTISNFILRIIPYKYTAIGIFFTSAILTYGGISVFILIFTIYPIAKSVFEETGLSKSVILSAISGGSIILGVAMPGSPQIHNLIMMKYLNTSSVAGLEISIISITISSLFALYYLYLRTRSSIKDKHKKSQIISFENILNLFLAISPIFTVFIFIAILKKPPIISLFMGTMVSLLKNIRKINILKILNNSIANASSPLMFAASAMGFGRVISNLSVFEMFLINMLDMPLNPYLLVGIITNITSGLLGSASGGIILVISTVGDEILQFVDPKIFHRVIIIASTGLDTLPHNNVYLAMLAYTGLKFKETYFDYFIVTVIAPLISFLCAIVWISYY